MKKFFQIFACCLIAIAAASCSRGAAAIDKAYEQAGKAAPVEEVAETLCNGGIKCETLTSDELAKLGAVLSYIQFNGMYSANFEDQVDMHQFGCLLDSYRNAENRMTGTERLQMEQYIKNIFIANPGAVPPPPAPEGEPAPAPAPEPTPEN